MNNDTVCAHCHYSFSMQPYAPCKCKLCLDSSSGPVKSFMKRQQIVGYRVCMTDLDPEGVVLSDDEILKKLENDTAWLRTQIERIQKRS